MPKHNPTAIQFEDLYARVENDTDTPWRDVLGLNHAELDALERRLRDRDNQDDDLDEKWEAADANYRAELAGSWWVVMWPEHVVTPRYNSDASYHRVESKQDAIDYRECAEVFGE